MSVFGRLNYNFDSDKFGDAQYLSEEAINGLKMTTTNDLYTWQKDRLNEGTPIVITEYRKNPLANLCNSILAQAESIIAVTESPPADWGTWVSGTANPPLLLAAAESIRDEIKLFTDHTCNISGVPSIHVSNDFPDPNIPTYDTAISYGRQVLNIVYQTDDVANAIPILGSFTSLYIREDLERANANLTTTYVNDFITNPSGTDTTVVTGATANLDSLLTLIQTRREHDWQFFANTKAILNDYMKLKRLGNAAKSNSDYSLVDNLIGTDKYKDNLESQIEEAAELEYNREYVSGGRFGTGGPPKPPGVGGADTETCTIPQQRPQYEFNFVQPTVPPPGGGGGGGSGGALTCTSKIVNYFWDFDFNNNRAPSPEPQQSPLRWIAIGAPNSVFSIRFPPANKWKELFGVAKNPDRISLSFGGVRAGYRAPPRAPIFLSQCRGDFDTPLPGNSKQLCTGNADGGYGGITVILSPTAPNYYAKWSQDKEFYINIKYSNELVPAGTTALGAFIDLFISAGGAGLGSGGTGTGGGEGGGGDDTINTDFSSRFTRVDSIINIPVPSVPPGVEAYEYYGGFLPDTWGTSAQDNYNREMSLGLSAIWSAYWNALPSSTKPYVTPPATSDRDPTWVYKATQAAQSWIQFNGRNPFK